MKTKVKRRLLAGLTLALLLVAANLIYAQAEISDDAKKEVAEDEVGFYLTVDGQPLSNAVVTIRDMSRQRELEVLEESKTSGVYKLTAARYDYLLNNYEKLGNKLYLEVCLNGSPISNTNISDITFDAKNEVNGAIAEVEHFSFTYAAGEAGEAIDMPPVSVVYQKNYHITPDSYTIPRAPGVIFNGWNVNVNGVDQGKYTKGDITLSGPVVLTAEWSSELDFNTNSPYFNQRAEKKLFYGVREVTTEEELRTAINGLNNWFMYNPSYVDWDPDEKSIIKITKNITLTETLDCKAGLITVAPNCTLTIPSSKALKLDYEYGEGNLRIQNGGKVVVQGDIAVGNGLYIENGAVMDVSGTVEEKFTQSDTRPFGVVNNGTINVLGGQLLINRRVANQSMYSLLTQKNGKINVRRWGLLSIECNRFCTKSNVRDTDKVYACTNMGEISIDHTSSMLLEGTSVTYNTEFNIPVHVGENYGFLNKGTIKVVKENATAARDNACIRVEQNVKMVNEGTIDIGACSFGTQEDKNGLYVEGTLENTKKGSINVTNTDGYGICIKSFVNFAGDPEIRKARLLNAGNISIENAVLTKGISAEKNTVIDNSGTITIKNKMTTSKINCVGLLIKGILRNTGIIINNGSMCYGTNDSGTLYTDLTNAITGTGATLYQYYLRTVNVMSDYSKCYTVFDSSFTVDGRTYTNQNQGMDLYVPAGKLQVVTKNDAYGSKTFTSIFNISSSLPRYLSRYSNDLKCYMTDRRENVESKYSSYRTAYIVNGSSKAAEYNNRDIKPGQAVTIEAKEFSGYYFTGWTVQEGNVTLETPSARVTHFTMPATEVVIKANYRLVNGKPSDSVTNEEDLLATR